MLMLSILLQLSCSDNATTSNEQQSEADSTAPVISLAGDNPLTLTQGSAYVEPGASAIDNIDGAVTVTISGVVNSNVIGSYTISYQATDSANNSSEVTRIVNVVALSQDPSIVLWRGSPIPWPLGKAYVDPGVLAFDYLGKPLLVSSSGSVNTNLIGNYTITYSTTDSDGRTATANRIVNVVEDTQAPVITLSGSNPMSLLQGTTYVESGATAQDDVDFTTTVTISGSVNTFIPGDYTITYSASDASNNSSNTTRTVTVVAQNPFVTTWKSDNPGYEYQQTITNEIEIFSDIGDYTIDWGDGQITDRVIQTAKHTYSSPNTYIVSIYGNFPAIHFPLSQQKLLSVEQWGDMKWQSMAYAFYGCKNLVINAVDVPDLSQVTDMSSMFEGAESVNADLSQWNVSTVTNMSKAFLNAYLFNQDISAWNVSSVTDMSWMFANTHEFNQNIDGWDVASVTDMSWMFSGAQAFNQDLNSWKTLSVIDMQYMFNNTPLFDGQIGNWNVNTVSNMSNMFYGTQSFNQSLNTWNVSAVTNMDAMFMGAIVFNQPLDNWNVSAVSTMHSMFFGAGAFNQNIGGWDITTVAKMTDMMSYSGLSLTNYDALLIGWSGQTVQPNVDFGAAALQYSSAAQSARDLLSNQYAWTITDGGVSP